MKGSTALIGALTLAAVPGLAAPPDAAEVRARVRAWREAHAPAILRELVELVALPNIAADGPAIRRNAELIARMLERRGMSASMLEVEGSPPAVYGELVTPGARRTLMAALSTRAAACSSSGACAA